MQVRAWTIQKHTKAPQAAGKIHSDMERGFIKAEVYKYEDIVEHKSEAAVKAAGESLSLQPGMFQLGFYEIKIETQHNYSVYYQTYLIFLFSNSNLRQI